MQGIEKLEEMVGKAYLFNDQVISIEKYEVQGDRVIITTDKKEMEVLNYILPSLLKDFIPIINNQLPALPALPVDNAAIKNLSDILLDNIRKVQINKDYIQQAEAIVQNVNAVINLEKIKIEYCKLLKPNAK